jgi:DNA-binding GntR family transcriptional regulator
MSATKPMTLTLTLTPEQLDQLAERVAAKMAPPVSGRPLSLNEAARELGVSRETIRLAVHAGKVKRVPNITAIRIPAAEIQRMKTA